MSVMDNGVVSTRAILESCWRKSSDSRHTMVPLSVYCVLATVLTAVTFASPVEQDMLENIDSVLDKLAQALSSRHSQSLSRSSFDVRNKRYYGMGCTGQRVHCPGRFRVCINKSQFCDGRPNCPKSLDENRLRCNAIKRAREQEKRSYPLAHALEPVRMCGPDEVACGAGQSGPCIPRDFLCDGYVDCYTDQWDESPEMCSKMSCPKGLVQCNTTGQCIPQSALCDGIPDCQDHEDENMDICGVRRCDPATTLCAKSNICLENDLWCDGYADCTGGEDETAALCALVPCDGLRCGGVCVATDSYCDGVADCEDGSDEAVDRCGPVRCPKGSVLCAGANSCVAMEMMCDGFWDCPGGADENKEHCSSELHEYPETYMYNDHPRQVDRRSQLEKLIEIIKHH